MIAAPTDAIDSLISFHLCFAFSADFSCAFVSDILLQGYMYITRNHVAFYSNVFGYVTKLLIPIASVTRISKKKTVKIFPNAIAVATSDERHVFSSFISRESAYQLMINVWQDAMPCREIEMLPTSAQLRPCASTDESAGANTSGQSMSVLPKATLQVVRQITQSTDSHGDVDASELDISENDSSSAVSGNEGLMRLMKAHGEDASNEPYDRNNISSSCNSNPSDCDLSTNRGTGFESKRLDSDEMADGHLAHANRRFFSGTQVLLTLGSGRFNMPRPIHIAYLAVLLAVLLALSAAYLNYRIVEIKNSHLTFSIDDLPNVSVCIIVGFDGISLDIFVDVTLREKKNCFFRRQILPVNIDLYARILNWQRSLQNEQVSHTQTVITNSLEQISEVN